MIIFGVAFNRPSFWDFTGAFATGTSIWVAMMLTGLMNGARMADVAIILLVLNYGSVANAFGLSPLKGFRHMVLFTVGVIILMSAHLVAVCI